MEGETAGLDHRREAAAGFGGGDSRQREPRQSRR